MSEDKFPCKKTSDEDTISIETINHSQIIKNGRSTDKIIINPDHRSLNTGQRLLYNYSLNLPLGLSMKSVILKLKQKIGSQVVFCDQQRGQMIIQGSRQYSFWDCLDCLVFWKMQGTGRGPLADSYNGISVKVNRNAFEQRCTLTVKPTHPREKNDFLNKLIKIIQHEVKSISASEKSFIGAKNTGLEDQSPLYKEIYSYKTIDKIITSHPTYKPLFEKAKQNIHQAITQCKHQPKTYIMANLIQSIVSQTDSLYNTHYSKEYHQLHPQYSLYSIQASLCKYLLPDILEIYKEQTKLQSKAYNQQCKIINTTFNNEKCWKYLECRSKYTLPSQKQPYFKGILALREISLASSLRQMLYCIQKCFSEIKLACLIEHQGNLELATMDDILPVMVYVVVRACINDFPAYVKMIDDYIRIRGIFQLEERVITTLYVAVEDITKKWATKNIEDKNRTPDYPL